MIATERSGITVPLYLLGRTGMIRSKREVSNDRDARLLAFTG